MSYKGAEKEVTFFKKLDDDELNKVNSFYKDNVEQVLSEAAMLNKQMDALIELRIKVEKPDFDGSAVNTIVTLNSTNVCGEGVNASDYKPDSLEIFDHEKINSTLKSPLSTIKGVLKDSKENDLRFNKEELIKV
ncbi:hypothetical protein HYC85_023379 [Camellia sinensis]|uniref:SPX domain-containing protein n=1 Tax=Camellia sinensis TaxID=4442 RepID=A0A7J7GEF7_CAMSI|nr:hypothetical protein HYC85_023379 [Camellia sinensis]